MAATAVKSVTVSKVDVGGGGDSTRVWGVITFSTNYQAGGDFVTPAQFGLATLESLDIGAATVTLGGTTALIAAVNKSSALPAQGTSQVLIQLFGMAGSASVGTAFVETNVADNSTFSVAYIAWGV